MIKFIQILILSIKTYFLCPWLKWEECWNYSKKIIGGFK